MYFNFSPDIVQIQSRKKVQFRFHVQIQTRLKASRPTASSALRMASSTTAVMSMPGFPTPPTDPQSGVQAEPTFPETWRHGLHRPPLKRILRRRQMLNAPVAGVVAPPTGAPGHPGCGLAVAAAVVQSVPERQRQHPIQWQKRELGLQRKL